MLILEWFDYHSVLYFFLIYTMSELEKIWSDVSENLRGVINNDSVFKDYIAVNKPISLTEDKLTLSVENSFLATWIENNYRDLISNALTIATGSKHKIVWVVEEQVNQEPPPQPEALVKKPEPVKQKVISDAKRQANCIGSLNPEFTFDEFVVGPSNSFTHAAAVAVSKSPGKTYNPLFIYGDTGLGKTHLMQAVGHDLLNKGKKIAYVTTETLLNEYSDAIMRNKTLEFRNKYRQVDLMMIDDIQFFANKPGVQEEFFHTFNALYQANKQIIITSDRPASEVVGLEKRLVSRFNAGLSVEMESPNFEMRLAILRYKQSHFQVTLSEEAESFIAENVTSNVRTLEGAMNRALAYKNLNPQMNLTMENLRFILRDLISEEKEHILTSETIRKVVCEFYGVDMDDLNKEGRLQTIVIPRQVAMYLCRTLTSNSLPVIAREFNRTHANIYHACTKIKKLYQSDSSIRDNINIILEKLGKTSAVFD